MNLASRRVPVEKVAQNEPSGLHGEEAHEGMTFQISGFLTCGDIQCRNSTSCKALEMLLFDPSSSTIMVRQISYGDLFSNLLCDKNTFMFFPPSRY